MKIIGWFAKRYPDPVEVNMNTEANFAESEQFGTISIGFYADEAKKKPRLNVRLSEREARTLIARLQGHIAFCEEVRARRCKKAI